MFGLEMRAFNCQRCSASIATTESFAGKAVSGIAGIAGAATFWWVAQTYGYASWITWEALVATFAVYFFVSIVVTRIRRYPRRS